MITATLNGEPLDATEASVASSAAQIVAAWEGDGEAARLAPALADALSPFRRDPTRQAPPPALPMLPPSALLPML